MAKTVNHKQRIRKITDIAIRMFSQVGYENVSLIMIAAATGISRTALYAYFKDKREVLDAAILSVTDTIAAKCSATIRRRGNYAVKLESVCHTVVDVMFQNKDFLIAVFDFVIGMVRTTQDMQANIAKFTYGTRNAIHHLLEQGKRKGDLRSDIDVDASADVLYSEFESCAMRIVLGTESNSKKASDRFSAIVRSLTPPAT